MNNRKELAKLIQQWADNPDSYFKYCRTKAELIPNSESDLNKWELVIPPKKWEPKGGCYRATLYMANNIFRRDTIEQAKNLTKLLKEVIIIDAWACEFGYKRKFEYDKANYYIFYSDKGKKLDYSNSYSFNHPGRVYMTQEGCRLLCEKINSGEVELP